MKYDVRRRFPDEWDGIAVPGRQPLVNGLLQFLGAMKRATADHAVGDQCEKPFDLVQPGTARGKYCASQTFLRELFQCQLAVYFQVKLSTASMD